MNLFARRCTSCGAVDESARASTREELAGAIDWTCASCGARDTWEIVKLESPRQA